MTVTRTGGIAGVRQTIRIAANGWWTYQDGRSGASDSGRLTATQRQLLTRLVTDPDFVREAREAPAPGIVCNDGFVYSLSVGGVGHRVRRLRG